MKILTKQEFKNCIKYGGISLLLLYVYFFHLDIISKQLWLIFGAICYVGIALEKRIDEVKASTNYACIIVKDIIPENNNAWEHKYPEYHPRFDGAVTNLIREFSLPFPPYLGMAVCNPFYSGKIEKVTWDENKKRFLCHVSPFKIKEEHTLGEILSEWTEAGWRIPETDSRAKEAWEKSEENLYSITATIPSPKEK